jgi:hypothetical protein
MTGSTDVEARPSALRATFSSPLYRIATLALFLSGLGVSAATHQKRDRAKPAPFVISAEDREAALAWAPSAAAHPRVRGPLAFTASPESSAFCWAD